MKKTLNKPDNMVKTARAIFFVTLATFSIVLASLGGFLIITSIYDAFSKNTRLYDIAVDCPHKLYSISGCEIPSVEYGIMLVECFGTKHFFTGCQATVTGYTLQKQLEYEE